MVTTAAIDLMMVNKNFNIVGCVCTPHYIQFIISCVASWKAISLLVRIRYLLSFSSFYGNESVCGFARIRCGLKCSFHRHWCVHLGAEFPEPQCSGGGSLVRMSVSPPFKVHRYDNDNDDDEDTDKDESKPLMISCSNSWNLSRKSRSSFVSLLAQKNKSNSNICCLPLSEGVATRLTCTPSLRTCLSVVKTRPAWKWCLPSLRLSRLGIASRSYHSNSWSSTAAVVFRRMHLLWYLSSRTVRLVNAVTLVGHDRSTPQILEELHCFGNCCLHMVVVLPVFVLFEWICGSLDIVRID